MAERSIYRLEKVWGHMAEPADFFVLLSKLYCSLGSGGASPGSKLAEREAEYTPPSSAEAEVG
jgi:hypothetical protein